MPPERKVEAQKPAPRKKREPVEHPNPPTPQRHHQYHQYQHQLPQRRRLLRNDYAGSINYSPLQLPPGPDSDLEASDTSVFTTLLGTRPAPGYPEPKSTSLPLTPATPGTPVGPPPPVWEGTIGEDEESDPDESGDELPSAPQPWTEVPVKWGRWQATASSRDMYDRPSQFPFLVGNKAITWNLAPAWRGPCNEYLALT